MSDPIRLAPMPENPRFRNITGETFGRLVVLGYAGKQGQKHLWWCHCLCGKTSRCARSNLISGNTTSCGCNKHRTIHGHAANKRKSPEYAAWEAMKDRCYNKSRRSYYLYGGRGIRVCERWTHSFEAFLADMGFRPSPKHTLDRFPDQNGNYEPGNCRWATREQQTRNQRNTHYITYQNETLCMTDWAQRLGIHPATLSNRLNRSGWSVERAFTEPTHKKPIFHTL